MNTLLNMDFKKVDGKLLHFPPQNSDDLRPLRAFQGREGETPRRSSPHPGASRPEIIKCVNVIKSFIYFIKFSHIHIERHTDRHTDSQANLSL